MVLEIIFWAAAGALLYSQLGYPLALAALLALAPLVRDQSDVSVAAPGSVAPAALPRVSLVIAAYAEQEVIARKVANALALDYPRDRLEVIVACDGSPDATAECARAAGADLVLELPRAGKVRAQDAAVARAGGELLAFSDANSYWAPNALACLVEPFADPRVGYACGRVSFVAADAPPPGSPAAAAPPPATPPPSQQATPPPPHAAGTRNQDGVYWRYEMWVRERESRLSSVTAGNGAIYATRPESYFAADPVMGHDLSFPFNMVKRGWRAVYEPRARAVETMVPSIEGEFRRKRRMMSHAWPIVLRGGLLSPRGYPPLYGWMIFSHRLLRYAAPLLHVAALAAATLLAAGEIGLLPAAPTLLTAGDGGWVAGAGPYTALAGVQIALVAAAAAAPRLRLRPLLLARYYVWTTASVAAGLWDHLRHGTPAGWSPPEGTR